jgi:hypothetical protein
MGTDGTARSVVGHHDAQQVAGAGDGDLRAGCLSVLDHVGECLRDDEVGDGLDARRGRARHVHPQPDRQRGARHQAGQCRFQPPVAEHGGMQAADELAQLRQRRDSLLVRRGDRLADRFRLAVEALPGHAEVHGQGNQPLLRPVVQVALDPAALGVGGGHRAGPAAGQ